MGKALGLSIGGVGRDLSFQHRAGYIAVFAVGASSSLRYFAGERIDKHPKTLLVIFAEAVLEKIFGG